MSTGTQTASLTRYLRLAKSLVRPVLSVLLVPPLIWLLITPLATPLLGLLVPFHNIAEVSDSSARQQYETTRAEYLVSRNPVLDRLLPPPYGGRIWVEREPDWAGFALVPLGQIALVADYPHELEQTEVHELTHLLQGIIPRRVHRLMKKLPPPSPDSYAATNSGEHFAEAAAAAWSLVSPEIFSDGMCLVDGPDTWLLTLEREIPGTAGFVLWFLEAQGADKAIADHQQLAAVADSLIDPYRDEWQNITAWLTQHRNADGTWPPIKPRPLFYQFVWRGQPSTSLLYRFAEIVTEPAAALLRAVLPG